MDPYDNHILKVLRDGKPRDFHRLLQEVDFSHNTLRLHLNNLVDSGLVIREKMPSEGPGRPVYTYSVSKGAGRGARGTLMGSSGVVALPFSRLRRLCRFQRGGRCRELKDLCEAGSCPQIRREE